MNKSKLAIAIDSISISILIFIISFFWIRYLIKSAFFIIFICIFISLCSFVCIFCYFNKKYHSRKFSLNESKYLSSCINNLKFSSIKMQTLFFENLLSVKFLTKNLYQNNKFLYYINLRNPLSQQDYFEAIDYSDFYKKDIIFICSSYDESFKKLYENENHSFYIFNSQDLYMLMKTKNMFPVKNIQDISFKAKLKSKTSSFVSTITKHRFKDYFFSGLSLVVFSFFIPHSFLYLIIGTFLLILSILCLFNSKNKIITNKNKISLIDTIKNSTK